MHRSREAGRFQMANHSSRPGDCRRYPPIDLNGNPSIGLTLTEDGAKAMKKTTSQNQKKKLAIVLNGKVVSAPTIQSTITKDVQITGRFDKDDLLMFFHAIVLRELPASDG